MYVCAGSNHAGFVTQTGSKWSFILIEGLTEPCIRMQIDWDHDDETDRRTDICKS